MRVLRNLRRTGRTMFPLARARKTKPSSAARAECLFPTLACSRTTCSTVGSSLVGFGPGTGTGPGLFSLDPNAWDRLTDDGNPPRRHRLQSRRWLADCMMPPPPCRWSSLCPPRERLVQVVMPGEMPTETGNKKPTRVNHGTRLVIYRVSQNHACEHENAMDR